MYKFIGSKNNCYLNSVLQALLTINYFVNFFKTKQVNENKIIQIFRNVCESNGTLIDPNIIKKYLSHFDEYSMHLFGNNNQQDAHDAIIKILDIIHTLTVYNETNFKEYGKIDTDLKLKSFNSWKEHAKIFGFSFVTRFFNGQFKIKCDCTKCDYTNTKFENFSDINLPIIGEDIVDCLNNYILKESIDDAKCEKCKHNIFTKTTVIWKFPSVLILTIKRFNSKLIKIKQPLIINKNLEVQNYNYKLISVIYQHGAYQTGHYTIDILEDNIWYNIDDETITKLTDLPNSSSDCYILIYNRINNL